MEEWVKVPRFENIEVTRSGRIRTCWHKKERMSRWGKKVICEFAPREYKPRISDNGYMRVSVQRNNRRGPLYAHRLIAFAFVSGYKEGYHVNHINGVKTDNRPENLEWVPLETNVKHSWRTGLCDVRGEKNGTAKLSARRVRAIRRALALNMPLSTVACIAGVTRNTIRSIKDGVTWQSVV